jgi:5-methyltetrahydropteroyltriglutamate--homocysteine methyltransferase
MRKSDDRILTTHTGSLPRPAELVAMYAARHNGAAIDEAALQQAASAAMRESVANQLESGVDIGNNGEQDRESFLLYVRHRMSGIGGRWKRPLPGDLQRYPLYRAMFERALQQTSTISNYQVPMATGEVKYKDAATATEPPRVFRKLLDGLGTGFAEAFMTAPSPGIVSSAIKNEHYPSDEAYLDALGDALRVEYEAIVDAGFLLQVDCPEMGLERHVSFYGQPLANFMAFLERCVAALNRALRNIPRDRVRVHVCWGNYAGPHDSDVPLETIWPVIRQVNAGGFVLPFANPRHAHESKVLRDLPLADDQIIVAGVIEHTTNIVEHPEVVAERIEKVARYVGDPHRVQAGTDCGFDVSAGAGAVAADVVWAKFRALRDGAKLATERLFS